jgi:hypothetical protein
MKDSRAVAALIGGLIGLGLLWAAIAPTSVTRAEMQDYVDVAATEYLRLLRSDIKTMNESLMEVRERLAGVEAVLRERVGG